MIVHVLDNLELRIQRNSDNLDALKTALNTVDTVLYRQGAWIRSIFRSTLFHQIIHSFEQDVHTMELAFSSAFTHKLDPQIGKNPQS